MADAEKYEVFRDAQGRMTSRRVTSAGDVAAAQAKEKFQDTTGLAALARKQAEERAKKAGQPAAPKPPSAMSDVEAQKGATVDLLQKRGYNVGRKTAE